MASIILSRHPDLVKEVIVAIEFSVEKDGKDFELEMRELFPSMHCKRLWKLVKRLEGVSL